MALSKLDYIKAIFKDFQLIFGGEYGAKIEISENTLAVHFGGLTKVYTFRDGGQSMHWHRGCTYLGTTRIMPTIICMDLRTEIQKMHSMYTVGTYDDIHHGPFICSINEMNGRDYFTLRYAIKNGWVYMGITQYSFRLINCISHAYQLTKYYEPVLKILPMPIFDEVLDNFVMTD
jgi:hypothetical protein